MSEESRDPSYRLWVLEKALETWGEEAQIVMAIEESAELQTALSRLYRGRVDDEDVVEEIADLQIMLDQLTLIFGEDRVEEAQVEKLHHLEERLEGASGDD